MMSADELASLRADMGLMMSDTVVWSSRSVDESTSEGVTFLYQPEFPGQPCHYQVLSGRELVRAQRYAAEATCAVYQPANYDVNVSDRGTITRAQGHPSSVAVEVVYVLKRSQELHRVAYCKDLTP